jgi:hypothetical protein
MFVLHGHKRENKMNDQMEQVWRSKDGKCVGSQEEVEAYLATLSPLGKMRFPYHVTTGGVICATNAAWPRELELNEHIALVAFANLAPLYAAVIDEWDKDADNWRTYNWTLPCHVPTVKLLLAYEKALELVPR